MRLFVLLGMLWVIGASAWQLVRAHGGGRRDYSRSRGAPGRGIFYSFTGAMLPAHKETVRLHPGKFAIGLLMHIGVFISLAALLVFLIDAELGVQVFARARPITALALLATLFLLIRRISSETMRAMSAPEDYLAALTTLGLLIVSILWNESAGRQLIGQIYVALLFFYWPLGKLRHAIFFFAARGEYGRRLGYRGVYPPPASRGE